MVEHPGQLGPVPLRPGRVFLEDADAAGRAKGGPLLVEVLAARRNAGITDEHSAGVGIWSAAHGFPLSQIMSQVA